MRGRFLLVAALLLPALTAPAQAALLDGGVALGDGSEEDPCLDVMAAVHDPVRAVYEPETVLHFASHCTFNVAVSFQQTQDSTVVTIDAEPVKIVIERAMENGTLVITIAVAYAEHGESFVVRCSDPDRLPTLYPVREMDASCWSVDEWFQVD